MTDAERLNAAIESASPALGRLLSPLGRRAAFPADIPFQAAEARGKELNATIGQITDGSGGAIPLASLAAGLASLPAAARNRALLYSPVEGLRELREAWSRWQRRLVADPPSQEATTLPVGTVGLTHGLSLVADLFAGPGRPVVIPSPFWGNYRQAFALRTGAEVVAAPGFGVGGYRCEAIEEALDGRPEDEPAVAILNLPSNPGGYSLTADERDRVRHSLIRAAGRRPLLVLCDDAYAGLVYDAAVPRASLFWELLEAHPNLVPVKADGVTKELAFFGGRVGFLTFPVPRGSEAETALESKVKCLLRATVGSPVATSQVLVLEALESGRAEEQIEEVRALLDRRYRALQAALSSMRSQHLRPLPFNSGCFALVELAESVGATADEVRKHLLEHQSTGLVSIAPRYLRIAFCSVAEERIPELVRRMERGVGAMGNT
jgi:aspartate/methionine/tyrosine aminotransferase